MKRFVLQMPQSLYDEFYRYFPGYGLRTTILRWCIRKLVDEAKKRGAPLDETTVWRMLKGGDSSGSP